MTSAQIAGPSLTRRILHRVFPRVPNFFALLAEQSSQVEIAAGLLVEYMGSGSSDVARRVVDSEHEGDRLKVRNLTLLNEAFSTPIDREDLHRAIINLDEIINSCNTIVAEMDSDVLALKADKYCLEMAVYLKDGSEALAAGYGRLGSEPTLGRLDAEKADKAGRNLTRTHRRALAELFNDSDFHQIFRRKEIYSQLVRAGDRLNVCNSTLLDIVVKLC
ncbi:MAG TPA: DUF47 family protein [Accumulibacter sp.]|uniref:DUF47 domain-containing protein n=1 Tax=Accumulibacter sp. TaxID=2053492 RepID=UPI0026332274|nr:DUF47 family protein [Accumulibacter sp.]MDS4053914.1 DUF47 family protein [Accumulibacter sp.]HMV06926.1 DUF47 family protein [Accumulibacter sp.]HMW64962.1 DUF47 family protein [Accumulibacter sp.]HMW82098.1 DUF47 family protein [Accumulibacter sp.]HMX70071.1 DUF47 family protein [Accumulibacter sp.]